MKRRVTIPQGFKDCNGVECDKNYEFNVEIPEPKPTIELIPEPKITIQDIPEPKPKPEVIIEKVFRDNSNRPAVQFTQFNGQLLPFARRYNI